MSPGRLLEGVVSGERNQRGLSLTRQHEDLDRQDDQNVVDLEFRVGVRADLGGHLKYSRRWSGVRAGVLLGAQGAVRRGENRGGL